MILPQLHIKLERWKYNSNLEIYVSTLGHFKDKNKEPIYPLLNKRGYMKLYIKGSCLFAHRVVLMTWRPLSSYKNMTVDHLNHNKRDNRLDNLEWVSLEENLRRAALDEINDDEDEEINKNYIIKSQNITDIAHWLIHVQGMLGTNTEVIGNRIRGVINTNRPYCDYIFQKYQSYILVSRKGDIK